jgi:DNA (cytosine-5)-methyltransferase 1
MREMARLQTFPDDFEVLGTIADSQRQLGNAVPSLLGEVLARQIARSLLGIDVAQEPVLALPRASGPTPPPERVWPVPERHLALRGLHEAHPGTGKGLGAARRISDATLLAAE